LKPKLAQQTMF